MIARSRTKHGIELTLVSNHHDAAPAPANPIADGPAPESLTAAARAVLMTAPARAKATISQEMAARWRAVGFAAIGQFTLTDRPARPRAPALVLPMKVPKRLISADSSGRIALLHALAHIELNAIDLAWDLVARFGAAKGSEFCDDWVAVGADEGRHFLLLDDRLAELGTGYGDLPAYDGLWHAAADTANDFLARLAVVPMVLEARGLDVTPATVDRQRAAGDAASADILMIIYRDEIGHVGAGSRWFKGACAERGLEPVATWRDLVARYFGGRLKPPFNDDARAAAGFLKAMYAPDDGD